MSWTFRLIGTNEKTSNEIETLTNLSALSGYAYEDLTVYTAFPDVASEGEAYQDINRAKYIDNIFRYRFTLGLTERSIFANTWSLSDLYSILTVLKKKYTYLNSTDFDMPPAPTDSARRVVYESHDVKNRKGNYYISITFLSGSTV